MWLLSLNLFRNHSRKKQKQKYYRKTCTWFFRLGFVKINTKISLGQLMIVWVSTQNVNSVVS